MNTDTLKGLLDAWLPTQRWYMGKGRAGQVEVSKLADLARSPDFEIWVATVAYGDGGAELYQLPLVLRHEPVDSLEHVLVGTVEDMWVYDALHDKDVTQTFLTGIASGATAGPVSYHLVADVADVPEGEPSLVLKGEQSNTSLIFGDKAILKVFRRLQPGVNPDIEVHEALTKAEAAHVARLIGYVTAEIDGAEYSLGMLQEFLTTGTDGWDLAKASVRDLLAEADLHAEEAGGDFAGESHRLGNAIATTHRDLAEAFGTGSWTTADLREQARAMHERFEEAVRDVPALAEYEPGLRAAFDEFAASEPPVTIQRIHGDLHLGQCMRTVRRWVVLDFEGQPLTDIEVRRGYDSPVRDIAGMLRSFDYASWHQLVDVSHTAQLEYRAVEWADRNRDAFCAGYAETSGADPRDLGALLRGFEADKAVYEAVYEARNRPNWLAIPLNSLNRILKEATPS